MTTLLVGATGATGRLLVQQLLDRGVSVKAIVRSPEKLPEEIRNHSNVSVIQGNILDFDNETIAQHVQGCDAVASCLGHNISFKGMYGHPRKLVTDTARKLCEAVRANNPEKPVKYVLMNTAGNRNRDLPKKISFAQQIVISFLRLVLPPHVDNEKAADYLRVEVGQDDPAIEWSVVRPDTLIDKDEVTEYEVYASPVRSAIFDPGITSRINVSNFMAELIANPEVWARWKGQMPVIYNTEES